MSMEQQIAADLDLIDMIQAFGTRSAKRKASAHRKACYAAIKQMNEESGFAQLTDDELLAELLG